MMRRYFSFPVGRRYHLFDTSVLLVGIALLWYITTAPSESTTNALDQTPIGVLFSPLLWGWTLLVAGCVGVVCSFRPRWLDAGYVAVSVALALWTLALIFGAAFAWATGATDWQLAGKAFGSALWFAFACRNLVAPLFHDPAEVDHE